MYVINVDPSSPYRENIFHMKNVMHVNLPMFLPQGIASVSRLMKKQKPLL